MKMKRLWCWITSHRWWDSETAVLPFVRVGPWGLWCCERCGTVQFMRIDWDAK